MGMLVLTRRHGESICIGDNIVIHVGLIDRNKVRLLIDAPREISVHRLEVYRRLHEAREDRLTEMDVVYPGGKS